MSAAISIVAKERDLFKRWRQTTSNFVIDGVVDEEAFLQERYRFVFILKEANQMGQTPLTDFLRNGATGNGGHTWNPVCRWLMGESRVFSAKERATILRKIAVVNLKKEDGGSVTNMSTLEQVVERDRDYIMTQLGFYAECVPVVFICCGSGLLTMLCRHVLGNAVIHRDAMIPYAKPNNDQEVYYVAFNHPNCRQSGLMERFKDIRMTMQNPCMKTPVWCDKHNLPK
jgi:hypothetical protein